jgi:Ca-activated chloride channel family protein
MKGVIKNIRFYKAGLILAVFWLASLMACSQDRLLSKASEKVSDNSLSPYFIVLTEGGETEQLPLKSTEVDVNIAGVIADVTVKQVYSNTGKNPLEAIYTFPASTRAAVYHMVMKIDDREIIAIIEEKQTARKMYEQAKDEGKTASLLEEQRPNVFQMNVANIMPGAKVEVILSYTELLIPTELVYEFVYPTVVGPRYVSNSEYENGSAETWTSNPYLREGVQPTSSFDLTMKISTGISLKEIRCETHKNKIKYTDKSNATLHLEESNGGNKDVVIQYKLAGNQIESGVLVYEDENGEKYFLSMMQPPERIRPESIPLREYIFIVDVSGSMSGFPLEVSKSLMKELLSGLKTTDKFNIVLFAGGSKVYSEQSLNATPENIKQAIQYMDNLSGGGGTELLNALKTAMNLNTGNEFSRSFVILTDGYVSVEKETFDYIRNNLGNANFFSFGIGSSVNRYIIEGMAHVGMGEPFIALNQAEAVKQAKKMLKYITSPVLTQIEYNISSIETYDVLPEKIPDLFASRPIVIIGKFKGGASGKLSIQGLSGDATFKNSILIKRNSENYNTKALKFLWAREQIRLLGDYNKLSANNEIREKIIDLSKKYNLLSEYTSFVAIDTEISNNSGSSTTVKQPLPLPNGVSNNAIGYYAGKPSKTYRMKSRKNSSYQQEPNISADVAYFDEEEEAVEAEVFIIVETMPKFQGGDLTKFQKYIQSVLVYPPEAIKLKLEGNVFIRFVIDKKGNITNVEIIRSAHKLLDDAALKAVRSSPAWTPGKQRGKPVNVTFTFPVKFRLK